MLSLNDLAPVLAFSDALGEALYALDRDWRVAAANEAALRWLGSDAIVGRLYWDLVPGARGTVVETAFRSAMAGRERVDVEAESSVHPGRFARGVAIPLADGLAVSFRDVTEEHSARTERQRQLAESEERLRLATEAASIGTWDVDATTGSRRWSARMRAILGIGEEVAADPKLFSALIDPRDRERGERALPRRLRRRRRGPLCDRVPHPARRRRRRALDLDSRTGFLRRRRPRRCAPSAPSSTSPRASAPRRRCATARRCSAVSPRRCPRSSGSCGRATGERPTPTSASSTTMAGRSAPSSASAPRTCIPRIARRPSRRATPASPPACRSSSTCACAGTTANTAGTACPACRWRATARSGPTSAPRPTSTTCASRPSRSSC